MRLKNLQLLGFKSFADKTKIEFTHGITAVVGPNGCGKSNIADAFRWVFGEQSAKSMRSSKMLDVIFSGSSKRKPQNFAEVTITLSGASESLATDYEEIAVTRRLHRSGDCEYLLNGKLVRLKDVQGLFLDSGIGRISFFEQGKMDQIIQSTPLERRAIFEEAAGILRFLQRRQESMRQLEQMGLNLVRVQDSFHEVEKQIVVLEAQAQKALAFKELKNELQQLEKGLFLAKWQKNIKKRKEAESRQTEIVASLQAENEHLRQLQQQEDAGKKLLETLEKAFYLESENLFVVRGEREVKKSEKRDLEERLKESRAKEMRWKRELEELLEQGLHHEKELAELKKKQKLEKSDFSTLEQASLMQKEQVAAAEGLVGALRLKQQEVQRQKLVAVQAENQIATDMGQNQVRLEGLFEKLQQQQTRREKLLSMEKEFAELIKEKQASVQSLKEDIEARHAVFHELEEKCQDLDKELKYSLELIEECKKELAEKEARQKALMRLKQDMVGFSPASKHLLALNEDEESPFFGKIQRLCECLKAKAGFEHALAAALTAYSQTLVVESVSDLCELASYANQAGLTDFSLFARHSLCLEVNQSEAHSAVLSDAIYIESCALARHFLTKLAVREDLEQLKELLAKHAGEELWFKDGVYIDQHGVYFKPAHGRSNLFLQEAELKALEVSVASLVQQKKERELAFKKLEQYKLELNAELMSLDKAIRRIEMTLVEANFGLQRLNSDVEKNRKEQSDSEKELRILQESISERRQQATAFQERHLVAKVHLSEVSTCLSSLEEELNLQTEKLKREKQSLAEQEGIYKQALQGIHKSEQAIHLIEAKNNASARQQVRLQEELALGRELQESMQAKVTAALQALQLLEQNLAAAEQICQQAEKAIADKKAEVAKIQSDGLQALAAVKLAESARQQIASQLEQQMSMQKTLKTEAFERYALTIEEIEVQFPLLEGPIEQAEKKARALRQTIEAAGDINMTAIEECHNCKQRHQFLLKQLEDLTNSRVQIEQIIAQLERESRKLFKETFELIAFNFRKNFAILFNGGQADLQFTGGDNPLEVGIDIIACPPGKQMRSISLLSGGEKCLTAMALLFAIFEVKVTPFCILDEIDAPLDDSNVERFANVVRQFTERCQFIIITHNKRTMAIADLLCGVSMEEQGVSKLLQMEFVSEAACEATVMI